VISERIASGRYINIDINRRAAARYGLNIADVQEVISKAVGGANVTQTVEGLERYPVNIRYAQEVRDSVEKLLDLPIISASGTQVSLGRLAEITVIDGPGMIRSEDARKTGWVFVDIRDRALGSFVEEAQRLVNEKVDLPPGYSIGWSVSINISYAPKSDWFMSCP